MVGQEKELKQMDYMKGIEIQYAFQVRCNIDCLEGPLGSFAGVEELIVPAIESSVCVEASQFIGFGWIVTYPVRDGRSFGRS
jgi:hypothetical protein